MGNTNSVNESPTVQSKYKNAQHVFLLVLGETGAGKSTLINTLFLWEQNTLMEELKIPTVAVPVPKCKNLECVCHNNSYPTSEKWKHLCSESNANDTSISQTSKPAAYSFLIALDDDNEEDDEVDGDENEGGDGPTDGKKDEEDKRTFIIVHILDTPGFGDTRIKENPLIEQENITAILQTIVQKQVPYLNALLYLYNGSQTRSAAMDKVIASLSQVFPRSFSNFRCLATNTGVSGTNASIEKQLGFREDQAIPVNQRYQYNNCLFTHHYPSLPLVPKKTVGKGTNKKIVDGKRNIGTFYREDWDATYVSVIQTLTVMFRDILSQSPVTPEKFVEIHRANSDLEVNLARIVAEIINQINDRESLERDKAVCDTYRNNLFSLQTQQNNYQKQIEEEKKKIVDQKNTVKSKKESWDQQINLKALERSNIVTTKNSVQAPIIYKNEFDRNDNIQESTSYHNTLCVYTGCYKNCHENCGLEKVDTIGHAAIKGCYCINGDNCHICSHSYLKHHHVSYKWVVKPIYKSVPDNVAIANKKKEMQDAYDPQIKAIDDAITQLRKNQSEEKEPPDNNDTIQSYVNLQQALKSRIDLTSADVKKATDEIDVRERGIRDIDAKIELLKNNLRDTHARLCQLTFSKNFQIYLSGLIGDWTDYRQKCEASTKEWKSACGIIEHLRSMLAK